MTAHAADNVSVSAASCSVAAGRDASNITNICNFGLTPEQLKQLTEAAVRGATEPLIHQIVDISKTLGVTEEAAKNLLKIVGEDSNIPEDKLAEALSKVGADYLGLKMQAEALNPDNPTARALVEEAKLEINDGHFQRAHELLREATQAQVAAAQAAERLEQQAHKARNAQMLGAASSTVVEGRVAMTERRYNEAAALFDSAAHYVPNGYAHKKGGYLRLQAAALCRQGDERSDNEALRNCIEVYGRALVYFPRSRMPLEWAVTKNDLANALEILGESEHGIARLEQAVAAYRAVLEKWTEELFPVEWAGVQSNLCLALSHLGQSANRTQILEQAVETCNAALEATGRTRDPIQAAKTANNLGSALLGLGERDIDTTRLQKAVAAYRAALAVFTHESAPREWAVSLGNQGIAMMHIAYRKNDSALAETAVRQIQTAYETERSEGQQRLAAFYKAQLLKASAVRDSLKSK
jgi:tetratricopeptide (TPR) repeat protein